MASEELREMARKWPEDFRNVAERADGPLGNHLMKVYREEQENIAQDTNAEREAVSA